MAEYETGHPDEALDRYWTTCPDCAGYGARLGSDLSTGLVTTEQCEMCHGEGGWRD